MSPGRRRGDRNVGPDYIGRSDSPVASDRNAAFSGSTTFHSKEREKVEYSLDEFVQKGIYVTMKKISNNKKMWMVRSRGKSPFYTIVSILLLLREVPW